MSRPKPKILVAAVSAAVAVALVGVLAVPRPPTLSTATSGDPDLIARVEALIATQGGARDQVSVTVIDGGSEQTAHFGASGDTEFEIGSVTKTFTAALFADAVARGEVQRDTRLGDLLDLGGGAAAEITLEQLATQSSGLPRLPGGLEVLARSALAGLRATDPYSYDLAELEAQARGTAVGEKEYAYSNLGFALLGQALAVAADTPYDTLVRERILAPIGMSTSSVPTSPDHLSPGSPTGYSASGRSSDPWTMQAYAPAGSIRSTSEDMADYARALLSGNAPGADALTPRADAGELERIGYAWFTTEEGMTWHNGMTGGFSSFVGLDRDSGRAVVVLSNTAVNVDDLGVALLEGTS